jgi:ABC-type Fe3+/spermidine/putrescine transport system ATPase subunit
VGITFIYVTHDQEEALTMSDRLAVMSHGQVEQLGTPHEVYERPTSSYVADFLGLANLMTGTVTSHDGDRVNVLVGGNELTVTAASALANGPVKVCIRPERILLDQPSDNSIPGVIDRVVYMGPMLAVLVQVEGIGELQTVLPNTGSRDLERGKSVMVGLPSDALRILPAGASA